MKDSFGNDYSTRPTRAKPPSGRTRQDMTQFKTCTLSNRAGQSNLLHLESSSVDPDVKSQMSKSTDGSSLDPIEEQLANEPPKFSYLSKSFKEENFATHRTRQYSLRTQSHNKMDKIKIKNLEIIDKSNNCDGRKLLETNLKGMKSNFSERTPLLQQKNSRQWRDRENQLQLHPQHDLEEQRSKRQSLFSNSIPKESYISRPIAWNAEVIWRITVLPLVKVLPAVTLGLLLNILDALSYGMILFPLGQPVFANLGPAGISMFFVSCITSQLVFSCGGSSFKGGIGSEMIEVVPFFHSMAGTIMRDLEHSSQEVIVANTILAYASSSILTGAMFFFIGYFRVGHIVGFIPRHILIGCIGGVGWFLVTTGLEISARLKKFEYTTATWHLLFQPQNLPLWTIPLCLAIFQICTDKIFRFKYYLPTYVLTIPLVFYTIVTSFSSIEITNLRSSGWIFEGSKEGEPWWYFYTLYNFRLVKWSSILKCVPAMFALTFFGILHVPINVPSLAYATGEDDVDLNRELLAHGASNTISGILGSVQNYLVYTNSVIVIKTGGGSRLGGVVLAVATAVIMMTGSLIIKYIPIMMVGALIFILGIDLLKEAIWKPRKKLKTLEYLTVIIIVVVMGVYDFVIGIFVGISIAFASLIFQTSRIPAVRATYSGQEVASTVRRNPIHHRYLKNVGEQIRIVKLNGFIFFGTITSVEEIMRHMIEDNDSGQKLIRYIILDFFHVTGLDFSAVEAFGRINRIMNKKNIQVIMSGFHGCKDMQSSLVAVDPSQNEVKIFEDLNSALEECETELLKTFFKNRDARAGQLADISSKDVPHRNKLDLYSVNNPSNSPRGFQLGQVATTILNQGPNEMRFANFKEPLRIILQIFANFSDMKEDFWFRAVPFFRKKNFLAGTTVYRCGDKAEGFFLLQQGIMRADYDLPQGHLSENIIAGTTFGELPFFSETAQTATVVAECDCITWLVGREEWIALQESEPKIEMELLRIGLKITSERMKKFTSYVLAIAS
ncbi:Uncharacterized protein C24H6.11c [Golovinomyces cichoracearum]|uniref:Uncharacterized protein C24H6.11c n=1 Tax=Golovinomyces cichoracearum TaxID=62708 RepID=A0A420IK29_9PEZI|nr:Uncharacterized protein C24H6.11c [Golovinomyces cichoracearum]